MVEQLCPDLFDRFAEPKADGGFCDPQFLLFPPQHGFKVFVFPLMIDRRVQRRIQLRLHFLLILHGIFKIRKQGKQDDHGSRTGKEPFFHHLIPLESDARSRRIPRLLEHFKDYLSQDILRHCRILFQHRIQELECLRGRIRRNRDRKEVRLRHDRHPHGSPE